MSEGNNQEIPLPKRSFNAEFWVGLFAIAGVLCFGYLAINIASIRLSDSGYYEVEARFDNIGGLQSGAPVEIAGVPIGEVGPISLVENQARVLMQVRKEIELTDADTAEIRTKGIIGDKFIKIKTGVGEVIEPGDELDTTSYVDFEELIGKFITAMNKDDEENDEG